MYGPKPVRNHGPKPADQNRLDNFFREFGFLRNGNFGKMAISAVQYLKIPQFESEVVYEAKTDKVRDLQTARSAYLAVLVGPR